MIDIILFKKFITDYFDKSQILIDEFKPDLIFIDVDCFPEKSYKLTIELSEESIKIATIEKKPELDFSLYDYSFESNTIAEDFIKKACSMGTYMRP